MKTKSIILSGLLLLIISCNQKKLTKTAKLNFREQIEIANHLIERSFINQNIDSLLALYAKGFTYMPEYKNVVFSKDGLNHFFKQWLESKAVLAYSKNIYEVKDLGGKVLEIGTFKTTFQNDETSTKNYHGNYMVVWEIDKKNNLKIKSEIFGSDVPINPDDVPYSKVSLNETTHREPTKVSPNLKTEILKINEGVIKAVLEGDGNARASGFVSDGIYMPHFGKMLIGMDNIKPYMLDTYKPEALLYVAHKYYDIYDFKEYVLINAHFKGGWGESNNGGTFEGNMSNLRKRTKDGQLLMYRQLANNDREVTMN
jgi:hypothetical protein